MEEGARMQEKRQEDSPPSTSSPAITPTLEKAKKSRGGKGGKRRTNLEMETFKMKMHPMMLEGKDPKTISEELGLPLSTTYKYISQIADETHKERLKKANVLVHNYFTREEKIISELNEQYKLTKEPRLLAELNHILNDVFDRLQSAGYIPKRKERIEFEGEVELKDWMGKFFKK
ncbi:MAG: hypothetical protein WC350_06055 [Candidatus Micrarchaeia archaeon]|jgi:hypothetical protein